VAGGPSQGTTLLIGHGGCGQMARENQGGMQAEAALAPLLAQGIVPVERSNPGSPQARKNQEVMAEFVDILALGRMILNYHILTVPK
jgi:hypothetical protein